MTFDFLIYPIQQANSIFNSSQSIIIKLQMISSIDQYEDIQKIQSFIIIISPRAKMGSQEFFKQKQGEGCKILLEGLEKIQSKQNSSKMVLEQSLVNNKNSIANLALKKIQYRTRLHENVQRYAEMKQKCEQLINYSPYKAKHWSSGNLKKRDKSHMSQLKMLNYHKANVNSTLNIKMSDKFKSTSKKLQVILPQLTINPFLLTIKNDNFHQKFHLFRTLKQKQTYSLYLAQSDKNKTIYTLKIINKICINPIQFQKLVKELKIQSYLNHINLVKVLYITNDKDFLYVFYECGITSNLSEQIKENGPFFQRQVRRIIKQICSAVEYLQRHNIIHQNIHPQSIYYQQGIAKLGQFNLSQYINPLRLANKSKSQAVLKEQTRSCFVDGKVDVWNIGILTYELLYGRIPIQLQQNLKINKYAKQNLYFCEEVDVSNTAKQFIMACLEKNYAKRLGIKQVMEHGFLRGGEKYRWTTA